MNSNKKIEESESVLKKDETDNINVSPKETESVWEKTEQNHVYIVEQTNLNTETTASLLDIQLNNHEITEESVNHFGKNKTENINVSPEETESNQENNEQNYVNLVQQQNLNLETMDSLSDLYKRGEKQLDEFDIQINHDTIKESENELEKNETNNFNAPTEENEYSQGKNEQHHVNLVEQPSLNFKTTDSLLDKYKQREKQLNDLDVQTHTKTITDESDYKPGKNETHSVTVSPENAESDQRKNEQNHVNHDLEHPNLNSEAFVSLLDILLDNNKITKESEKKLGKNETVNESVSSEKIKSGQGKNEENHVNLLEQQNLISTATDSLLDKYKQGVKQLNEFIHMINNEFTEESENKLGKNETVSMDVSPKETENSHEKNKQQHVNLVEQPDFNSKATDSLLDFFEEEEKQLNELDIQKHTKTIADELKNELWKSKTDSVTMPPVKTINGLEKMEQNHLNFVEHLNLNSEATDSLLDIQLDDNKIIKVSENKLGKNETYLESVSFEETESGHEKTEQNDVKLLEQLNLNSKATDSLLDRYKQGKKLLNDSQIDNKTITDESENKFGNNETGFKNMSPIETENGHEKNEQHHVNLTEQPNFNSKATDSLLDKDKQREEQLHELDIPMINNKISEATENGLLKNETDNVNVSPEETESSQRKNVKTYINLVKQLNLNSAATVCLLNIQLNHNKISGESENKLGLSKTSNVNMSPEKTESGQVRNGQSHSNLVKQPSCNLEAIDLLLDKYKQGGKHLNEFDTHIDSPKITEGSKNELGISGVDNVNVISNETDNGQGNHEQNNVVPGEQPNISLEANDFMLDQYKLGERHQEEPYIQREKNEITQDSKYDFLTNGIDDINSTFDATEDYQEENQQDVINFLNQSNFNSKSIAFQLEECKLENGKLNESNIQIVSNKIIKETKNDAKQSVNLSSNESKNDDKKQPEYAHLAEQNSLSSRTTDSVFNCTQKRKQLEESDFQIDNNVFPKESEHEPKENEFDDTNLLPKETENDERKHQKYTNLAVQTGFTLETIKSSSEGRRKRGRPKTSTIQIMSPALLQKNKSDLIENKQNNDDLPEQQNFCLENNNLLTKSFKKRGRPKKTKAQTNKLVSPEEAKNDEVKILHKHTDLVDLANFSSGTTDSSYNQYKQGEKKQKEMDATFTEEFDCEPDKNGTNNINLRSEKTGDDQEKNYHDHKSHIELTNCSSEIICTLSKSYKKRGRPKKPKIQIKNFALVNQTVTDKDQCEHAKVVDLANLSSGKTEAILNNCGKKRADDDKRYKHDRINLVEQANFSSEKTDYLLDRYKQGERKLKDLDIQMENNTFTEASEHEPDDTYIPPKKSVNVQENIKQNPVNLLQPNLSSGITNYLSDSCKKKGRPRKSEIQTMGLPCIEQIENNQQPNKYDGNLREQGNSISQITHSLSNSARKRGRPKKSVVQSNSHKLSEQTVNKHIHVSISKLPIFNSKACDYLIDMHKPEERKLKESEKQMNKNKSSSKFESKKCEIDAINLSSEEIEIDRKNKHNQANLAEQTNSVSETVYSLTVSHKKRDRPKKSQIHINSFAFSKEVENDERKKQFKDINLITQENLVAEKNDSLSKCYKEGGRQRKLKIKNFAFSEEIENDEKRNYHKHLNQVELATFKSVDSTTNSCRDSGKPNTTVMQTNSLILNEQKIANKFVRVNLYKLPIFSSGVTDTLLEKHKEEEKKLKVSDIQTSKNDTEHEPGKNEHDLAIHSHFSSGIFDSLSISCKKRGRPKKLKVDVNSFTFPEDIIDNIPVNHIESPNSNSVSSDSLLHRQLLGKRKLIETDIRMDKIKSTTESESEKNETSDINSLSEVTKDDLKNYELDNLNLIQQTNYCSDTNNSLSKSYKKRGRPKKLKIEVTSLTLCKQIQNQEKRKVHDHVNLEEQIFLSLRKNDSEINSCRKRGRPKKSQIQNNSPAPSDETENDEQKKQRKNVNPMEEVNFTSETNDSTSDNFRKNGKPKKSVMQTNCHISSEEIINNIVQVNLCKLPNSISEATDSLLWSRKQEERELQASDIFFAKNISNKHSNYEHLKNVRYHANLASSSNCISGAADSPLINCKKRVRLKKPNIQVNSTPSEQTLKKTNFCRKRGRPKKFEIQTVSQPSYEQIEIDESYEHGPENVPDQVPIISGTADSLSDSCKKRGRPKKSKILPSNLTSEESENDKEKQKHEDVNVTEQTNFSSGTSDSVSRPKKSKIQIISLPFSEKTENDEKKNKHNHLNLAEQAKFRSETMNSISNICRKRGRPKKLLTQTNSLTFTKLNINKVVQVNLYKLPIFDSEAQDFLSEKHKQEEKKFKEADIQMTKNASIEDSERESEKNKFSYSNVKTQPNCSSGIVDSLSFDCGKENRSKIQVNRDTFSEQVVNNHVLGCHFEQTKFKSAITDSLLDKHIQRKGKVNEINFDINKNVDIDESKHELAKNRNNGINLLSGEREKDLIKDLDYANLIKEPSLISEKTDLLSHCIKKDRPRISDIHTHSLSFSEQTVNNHVHIDLLQQPNFISGATDLLLDTHKQVGRNLKKLNIQTNKNTSKECAQEHEENEIDYNLSSEEFIISCYKDDLVTREGHLNFSSETIDSVTNISKKRGRPRKSEIQINCPIFSEQVENNRHDHVNLELKSNISSEKAELSSCRKRGRPRKSEIQVNCPIFSEQIENSEEKNGHDCPIFSESLNLSLKPKISSEKAELSLNSCRKRGRPRKSEIQVYCPIFSEEIEKDEGENRHDYENLTLKSNISSEKADFSLSSCRKRGRPRKSEIETNSLTFCEDRGRNEQNQQINFNSKSTNFFSNSHKMRGRPKKFKMQTDCQQTITKHVHVNLLQLPNFSSRVAESLSDIHECGEMKPEQSNIQMEENASKEFVHEPKISVADNINLSSEENETVHESFEGHHKILAKQLNFYSGTIDSLSDCCKKGSGPTVSKVQGNSLPFSELTERNEHVNPVELPNFSSGINSYGEVGTCKNMGNKNPVSHGKDFSDCEMEQPSKN